MAYPQSFAGTFRGPPGAIPGAAFGPSLAGTLGGPPGALAGAAFGPSLAGTLRGPPGAGFGPSIPLPPPLPPIGGTLSGSPFPPGTFGPQSLAGSLRGAPAPLYGGAFGGAQLSLPPAAPAISFGEQNYQFGESYFSSQYSGLYPRPHFGDKYRDNYFTDDRDRYDRPPPRPRNSYLDDKEPDFLHDPAYCCVTRVLPYLYLTNKTGCSDAALQRLGITCVIAASEAFELQPPRFPYCDFRRIPVPNDPSSHGPNIIQYFDEVADLIDENERKGGRVLVHSLKGRSRGPTLVVAYLIKYKRMTLSESFALVSGERSIIRPFYSFWKQLIKYEKELYGRSSAAI